jgi:hypothetical protein
MIRHNGKINLVLESELSAVLFTVLYYAACKEKSVEY